jgi:predicted transcriptional regulator
MYCYNYQVIEDHSYEAGCLRMRQENVTYFTEREEEFANLLIKIGIRKNIARVLVFFAKTPETTSRVLERSTGMRQSEVSITIRYLMDQGWIKFRESPSEKGRPHKSYSLAVPIKEIIAAIEKSKKNEANNLLALLNKMRNYF